MNSAAISSTTNPRIKRVRALQSNRGEREGIGRFVIEGEGSDTVPATIPFGG